MLRDWYLNHARPRDRRREQEGIFDRRPDAIGFSRADLLVAMLRGVR